MNSQPPVTLQAVYSSGQPAQFPVAIDYPAALALRQMALVQDELPKYLLAPEVSALLHYVPDLHRKMLLATLWNTGARINEALALTRGDFSLAPPYPFVQLATLKQREEKATRTAGRTPQAVLHIVWSHSLIRSMSRSCR
jgi:integrase